jgi:hypothetical protein
VKKRDEYLLEAYNRHLCDLVVGDRKAYVLKLKKDRESIGAGLLGRIASLETENERLRCGWEKANKG